MFFMCELKRLRKLKASLLARYRCEHILATLPTQLSYRIDNCDEAAALKVAEENLANAKKSTLKTERSVLRKQPSLLQSSPWLLWQLLHFCSLLPLFPQHS